MKEKSNYNTNIYKNKELYVFERLNDLELDYLFPWEAGLLNKLRK